MRMLTQNTNNDAASKFVIVVVVVIVVDCGHPDLSCCSPSSSYCMMRAYNASHHHSVGAKQVAQACSEFRPMCSSKSKLGYVSCLSVCLSADLRPHQTTSSPKRQYHLAVRVARLLTHVHALLLLLLRSFVVISVHAMLSLRTTNTYARVFIVITIHLQLYQWSCGHPHEGISRL